MLPDLRPDLTSALCVVQAVVDKSAVVASAVLTSAMHLLGSNTDLVKRWTNEIQACHPPTPLICALRISQS